MRQFFPHSPPCTVRSLALAALFLLVTCPLAADEVLEIERNLEVRRPDGQLVSATTERGFLYLGDGVARFDQGENHSWLLRRDDRRLFMLDHAAGTYQEFTLPVKLEDYLTAAQVERLRRAAPVHVPELEVEETAEETRIGAWTARRVVLRGKPPEGQGSFDYELWQSSDLGVDLTLYRELLRNHGAVDFIHRGLAREMAALEGFPVLRKTVTLHDNGDQDFDERKLVALYSEAVPRERYGLPSDYRRVDFDLEAWIVFPE